MLAKLILKILHIVFQIPYDCLYIEYVICGIKKQFTSFFTAVILLICFSALIFLAKNCCPQVKYKQCVWHLCLLLDPSGKASCLSVSSVSFSQQQAELSVLLSLPVSDYTAGTVLRVCLLHSSILVGPASIQNALNRKSVLPS